MLVPQTALLQQMLAAKEKILLCKQLITMALVQFYKLTKWLGLLIKNKKIALNFFQPLRNSNQLVGGQEA